MGQDPPLSTSGRNDIEHYRETTTKCAAGPPVNWERINIRQNIRATSMFVIWNHLFLYPAVTTRDLRILMIAPSSSLKESFRCSRSVNVDRMECKYCNTLERSFAIKGWELTFLIRAFGLSEKLSIGVGFGFSDIG